MISNGEFRILDDDDDDDEEDDDDDDKDVCACVSALAHVCRSCSLVACRAHALSNAC
jgi:hypothetical protein